MLLLCYSLYNIGTAQFTGPTPFYPPTTQVAFGFYVKEDMLKKGLAVRIAELAEQSATVDLDGNYYCVCRKPLL